MQAPSERHRTACLAFEYEKSIRLEGIMLGNSPVFAANTCHEGNIRYGVIHKNIGCSTFYGNVEARLDTD